MNHSANSLEIRHMQCMPTHVYMQVHTNMHTCMHACMLITCMRTCKHKHTHSSISTGIERFFTLTTVFNIIKASVSVCVRLCVLPRHILTDDHANSMNGIIYHFCGLRSFGGQVSWDETACAGATYQETDETITHQVVDRPKLTTQILSR